MFYMPDIGRFLARDMIRRSGRNPYLYTEDDPIQSVDPIGLPNFQEELVEKFLADASNEDDRRDFLMTSGPKTGVFDSGVVAASGDLVSVAGQNLAPPGTRSDPLNATDAPRAKNDPLSCGNCDGEPCWARAVAIGIFPGPCDSHRNDKVNPFNLGANAALRAQAEANKQCLDNFPTDTCHCHLGKNKNGEVWDYDDRYSYQRVAWGLHGRPSIECVIVVRGVVSGTCQEIAPKPEPPFPPSLDT